MSKTDAKPEAVRNDEPKFYFLAAGYVFFHPQGKPEEGNSAFLNGVFANETGVVSAKDLGIAQRTLMQTLQERAEGVVEVVAVEFASISHLGQMKPSEFHNVAAPQAPASAAQ